MSSPSLIPAQHKRPAASSVQAQLKLVLDAFAENLIKAILSHLAEAGCLASASPRKQLRPRRVAKTPASAPGPCGGLRPGLHPAAEEVARAAGLHPSTCPPAAVRRVVDLGFRAPSASPSPDFAPPATRSKGRTATRKSSGGGQPGGLSGKSGKGASALHGSGEPSAGKIAQEGRA